MSATTPEWSARFDAHFDWSDISLLLDASIKRQRNFHAFRA